MSSLLLLFVFCIGFNLLLFLPAYFFKTDKLTDMSYALTFFLAALYLYMSGSMSTAQLLLLFMIFLWALRLGGYLLIRIFTMGKDKRFDERRNSFWKFGTFWLLQGVSVAIIMIPAALFLLADAPTFTVLSLTGLGIWFLGLVIETVADAQKFRFIQNKKHQGKWIASGLWKYSRHPNYLGEMMVWIGVYVFTASSLQPLGLFIGLLSPLYIIILLMFVSGVPLLEKSAEKKWGKDPNYQQYKRQTGIILPRF